MKKNVIAHMTAPKRGKLSLFRRLDILPRILCLLLALLIWLAVFQLSTVDRDDASSGDPDTTVEATV